MSESSSSEPKTELCPDWIIAPPNWVDIAVTPSRGWFSSYTPLDVDIVCSESVNPTGLAKVVGIGDVLVPVKIKSRGKKKFVRRILHLHNAVHVPEAPCNFLGPEMHWMWPKLDLDAMVVRDRQDSNGPLLRKAHDAYSVVLSGPPHGPITGPSPQPPVQYNLTAFTWQFHNRIALAKYKVLTRESGPPLNQLTDAPYDDAEDKLIYKEFGGERKFLALCRLSMDVAADRAQGRAISRELRRKRFLRIIDPEGDTWEEVRTQVERDLAG